MPINYKDYPDNWLTEIRPAVLKRADNKCEECGVPNYAIIYRPKKGSPEWKLLPEGHIADVMVEEDRIRPVKIVLTIAHLDHDKHNHEITLDRLKALCQRCHLHYDKNIHALNRKYGRNWKQNQQALDL